MGMWRTFGMAAALIVGFPAGAEERRDLCPDRPGLGTPACTVDEGDMVLEVGIGDWARDREGSLRIDTIVAGDALIRVGLTPSLEAQIGWTAVGRVRERDRASGTAATRTNVGDVTIALRQNLRNPDGSGFSVAAMPYVTLPMGGRAIGAGDWGAGLLLPASVAVGGVSLGLTPQVAAATDGDGKGRHLAYGATAGVGFGVTGSVSMALELAAVRDHDPEGHVTEWLGGISAGWQPDENSQWDIGTNIGLNRDSPDMQIYMGFVQRF